MALPRPTWKGYLRLALVSCPISVYSATSAGERVRFNLINKKTGHRLRQQLVDEGTSEKVDAADKVRGYEIDKGVYVQFEDEELDGIAIESLQTIDIDAFVPRDQIDNRFLDTPYYLGPTGRIGTEAFVTIRDAMKLKNLVALGRVVMAKRERVMMLQPWEKGMVGTTLRYAYEVRDEAPYFADIENLVIAKELMSMAIQIIETRTADFDPGKFHDRYEDALLELIERKKAGLPPEAQRPLHAGGGVIDFMEALKRSVAASSVVTAPQKQRAAEVTRSAKAKSKGKAPKRIEGQKEMLLPIPGKKATASKEEKKPAAGRGRKAS